MRDYDALRVGKHVYTFADAMSQNLPVDEGRRCVGIDEMDDAGWFCDRRRFTEALRLRVTSARSCRIQRCGAGVLARGSRVAF